MPQIDRRAGSDRRSATRYRVTIDIEWEGAWGRKSGTLSDISELGCFVLCSGDVDDGSTVKVFLPLNDGKVQFEAVVANHLMEVGFAAKFVNLSPAQAEFLKKFVDSHKED